jgi:hypothetical protein
VAVAREGGRLEPGRRPASARDSAMAMTMGEAEAKASTGDERGGGGKKGGKGTVRLFRCGEGHGPSRERGGE